MQPDDPCSIDFASTDGSYDHMKVVQMLTARAEKNIKKMQMLQMLTASAEKNNKKRKRGGDAGAGGDNSDSDASDDGASNRHNANAGLPTSLLRVSTSCLHGVDATDVVASLSTHATQLSKDLGLPCKAFDRVIWNFPHTGEQRVHLNRNLIRDFLEKVPGILANDGRVYITLNWKPPYSLWNLNAMLPKELQAKGYLKFSPDLWPGYGHQTTLGGSGGAKPVEEGIDGGRSYVFTLAKGTAAGTGLNVAIDAAISDLVATQNEASLLAAGLDGRLARGDKFSGAGGTHFTDRIDSSTVNGVKTFLENGGYDAGIALGRCGDAESGASKAVIGWADVNNDAEVEENDPFALEDGDWT